MRYRAAVLCVLFAAESACVSTPALQPERLPRAAAPVSAQVQPAGAMPEGIPLRIGRPAVPGLDGPMAQTTPYVPALPFEGDAPTVRSTAEMMADAARRPARRAEDRPAFRRIRPDRRRLQAPPDALNASRWPVRQTLQADTGTALAPVTVSTPNTEVANSTDTPFTPPDTMGDVGPTQVVVVLNGLIRTIRKTDGLKDGVLDLDTDVFFNEANTGDPRVRYDARTQRWYVLVFTIAVPNKYLLAVSSTATITPTTSWTIHQWANTRTADGIVGGDPCFGDYPTLGVDEDALYIGVNQFCGADIDAITFESTSAYVVRKSALPSGLVVAQFDALMTTSSGSGLYTPQGVDNVDANTNTGYFIGVDGFYWGLLQMRRIMNPGGTPTMSGNISMGSLVGVPTTRAPMAVPQPGVAQTLDSIDDRLLQATIRNGRLWTTHQVGVNASGVATDPADRTGIRWYELQNLGTDPLSPAPTVRQAGTVFDASATQPLSYWMGAINVNALGQVVLGMSRAGSGPTGYPNAAVTSRSADDPLGTMATPALLTSNTAFTLNTGIQPSSNLKRWGDYSNTMVDPVDGTTMWTLQEYVSAGNRWAIRLAKLGAPQLAPTNLTVASVVGNTVTLRWRWAGATPNQFVVSGGVSPGETLASIETGSAVPMVTFTAPSGAFYVRVAAVTGSGTSTASSEVRLFVNVPQAPPAPTTLLGVANGTRLELSWMNTRHSGTLPGTANVLDVTGPVSANLSMPLTEQFAYPAVPPGTYTFRVRTVNASGSSPASNPVTLTFPGSCQVPSPPAGLQAHAVGRTLHVWWDSPVSGTAASRYVLTVGGAYSLPVETTAREISSAVPAGTYTFSVIAQNACGSSTSSPQVSVTVQ